MRKAEVRKNRWRGWWAVEFDTPNGRYRAIHPTHAAALAHALAEVGLTEKEA